ncbi:MAG: 2-amino-4-hydroxy-6-hydroxymethyldihydropteridine diphosphokinase [Paramuribaculum sp.]|nr:2-amino-4-hydroxy-6-hydroxymethyldihydropteridine diphosphokinase [Paramuribaculum sp.]
MHTAYINIGSNLGDRHGNIAAAVAAVKERINPSVRLSDPVESPPWGYESSNPYINIGVAFQTVLPPEELLAALLDVQKSISDMPHRNGQGGYTDRIIDIDLIAVDEIVYTSSTLTLPHPRMHLRPFVLIPMLQLAPRWSHPRLNLTPAQLLASLTE